MAQFSSFCFGAAYVILFGTVTGLLPIPDSLLDDMRKSLEGTSVRPIRPGVYRENIKHATSNPLTPILTTPIARRGNTNTGKYTKSSKSLSVSSISQPSVHGSKGVGPTKNREPLPTSQSLLPQTPSQRKSINTQNNRYTPLTFPPNPMTTKISEVSNPRRYTPLIFPPNPMTSSISPTPSRSSTKLSPPPLPTQGPHPPHPPSLGPHPPHPPTIGPHPPHPPTIGPHPPHPPTLGSHPPHPPTIGSKSPLPSTLYPTTSSQSPPTNKSSLEPVTATSTPTSDKRICATEYKNQEYDTSCKRCPPESPNPCKDGEIIAEGSIRHCSFLEDGQESEGCTARCLKREILNTCCNGYWGDSCEAECPGGAKNPCSGHGLCLPNNGTCKCEAGFNGDLCANCSDPLKYGPNCLLDKDVCETNYHSCTQNSRCESQTGQGSDYECVCIDGYVKDDDACVLSDPCSSDNGGCGLQSCRVKNLKVDCYCEPNYEIKSPGDPCTLIDPCSSSPCHTNANCTSFGEMFICTCTQGYIGNGFQCYGNILQRMEEVNKERGSKLRGALDMSIQYLKMNYEEQLTEHGPFTMFLPIDRAFKGLENFNTDRFLQILRQHILIGNFTLDDLSAFDTFYTLEGKKALLQIRPARGIFKYKLAGERPKTKVTRKDIIASNGMIHIVNNMLTTSPEVDGDTTLSALELFNQRTRHYTIMASLISTSGLQDEFSRPNTTVLGVGDEVWNKLPPGTLEYLKNDQNGKAKLEEILLNHVFDGVYGITDLINIISIKSMDDNTISVSVSKDGQVRFDDKSGIIQANIPTINGYLHHVDNVLLPSYMPVIVENFCNMKKKVLVKGHCQRCSKKWWGPKPKCHRRGDKYVKSEGCRSRRNRQRMCRAICTREVEIRNCCQGFYGSKCVPCPGGIDNPCGGKGKCDEGYSGSGKCECDENFSGPKCSECKNVDSFGPDCKQNCTCVHGICNGGPQGDGHCKVCHDDMHQLPDCDRRLVSCPDQQKLMCHVHATCLSSEKDGVGCVCNQGYADDGYGKCVEVDLCKQISNGGCHQQASCTQISPQFVHCECKPGWVGDGKYCSIHLPCDDPGGESLCKGNETCINTLPGQYQCECKEGFLRVAERCVHHNPCILNNGGCAEKALCFPPSFDYGYITHRCDCPINMYGNGKVCYGTIAEQILARPELSEFASYFVKRLPIDDLLLSEDGQNFTLFAPANGAFGKWSLSNETNWDEASEDILLATLNFHTLDAMYTTDDLAAFGPYVQYFPTLFDGWSLQVINTVQTIKVRVKQNVYSTIIHGDIQATNGIIHIVDMILEPFIPSENTRTVEELLMANESYSLFYDAMKEYDMFKTLSDMNQFTLFIPTNDYFRTIPGEIRHMRKSLKHYILPKILFMGSVDQNGYHQVYSTSEGFNKISIERDQDMKLTVDSVTVLEHDILVDGGVANIIAGRLVSMFNWCNTTNSRFTWTACRDCDTANITDFECPFGSVPLVPTHMVYGCASNDDKLSCSRMCGQIFDKDAACCSGFYGLTCAQCPGDSDVPCNAHGTCRDTLSGNGTCVCDAGFYGDDCSRCEDHSLAQPHCNSTHPSCEVENSGCHENAVCTSIEHGGPRCTCKTGFHGDGERQCKKNINPCESESYGGCDKDRALCDFIPPDVTDFTEGQVVCSCTENYVGDGHLCSMDVLDTIYRLPELGYFSQKIKETNTSFATMLENINDNFTVFAPISKDYGEIDVNDMIVKGERLVLTGIVRWRNDSYNNDTSSFSNKQVIFPVTSLVTMSGFNINITVDIYGQMFANGVPIQKANVVAINGVIHLTQFPVQPYNHVRADAYSSGNSDATIVTASVIAVVGIVVVAIVVGILLLRKYRRDGSFSVFSNSSEGSDTNVSFARLSAQEEEDEDQYMSRGSDSAKYDNPIFDEPELLLN